MSSSNSEKLRRRKPTATNTEPKTPTDETNTTQHTDDADTEADGGRRLLGRKLPAFMERIFRQRKEELLREHPNFMTEEIPDARGLSPSRRFDLYVLLIMFFVGALTLWVEYRVNIFAHAYRGIIYCLSPHLPTSERPIDPYGTHTDIDDENAFYPD